MKKFLLLLVALMSCHFFAFAEDCSFINAQIKQINKVLADNSTEPNDPQANFTADTTNKILTLNVARNISLSDIDKSMFEIVAGMLPKTILTTVYITSKGVLNGQVMGNKFIKQLQDGGYTVIVVIAGIDVKFEFKYPNSILSL